MRVLMVPYWVGPVSIVVAYLVRACLGVLHDLEHRCWRVTAYKAAEIMNSAPMHFGRLHDAWP